jgi:hypothetical protein
VTATPVHGLNNFKRTIGVHTLAYDQRRRIGMHTLAYDQLLSKRATDIENAISDQLYSNWYASCLQNGVPCGSLLKIENTVITSQCSSK